MSGQVFDAEKYNIIINQWFCALNAYSYRINGIEMVLVIEFTRIYYHAVMQTLVSFEKLCLAFIDRLSHRDDLISWIH